MLSSRNVTSVGIFLAIRSLKRINHACQYARMNRLSSQKHLINYRSDSLRHTCFLISFFFGD